MKPNQTTEELAQRLVAEYRGHLEKDPQLSLIVLQGGESYGGLFVSKALCSALSQHLSEPSIAFATEIALRQTGGAVSGAAVESLLRVLSPEVSGVLNRRVAPVIIDVDGTISIPVGLLDVMQFRGEQDWRIDGIEAAWSSFGEAVEMCDRITELIPLSARR